MMQLTGDKKLYLPAVIFTAVFLILTVFYLLKSLQSVRAAGDQISTTFQGPGNQGWHDAEIRNLTKEILWYEQFILMAGKDSIGLSINLNDSSVQISIRGLSLLQTKILRQYPSGFLNQADEAVVLHYGQISHIVKETAGIPKKPVRKMVAFANDGEKTDPSYESMEEKTLHWKFLTSNNLQVVITGVEMLADSTRKINAAKDILKHRVNELAAIPFPRYYTPTLFLWIDNSDARAIYRALPSKGNVLFRN